jgi:cysteine-rich repeat protein
MQLSTVAKPIGSVPIQPTHTGPEFAAFIVMPAVTRTSLCGNGVIDPGEECDDGGIVDGDGCSASCVSEALCDPTPATSCRHVTQANKSSLVLTRHGGTRDTLVWRWNHGAATSLADFGDPTAGTRYAVCVYDGTSSLVQHFDIPAQAECGDPTWRPAPSTWKYKASDQLPDGKLIVSLKAGDKDGRSVITVNGKGSFLSMIPLPAPSLPLRVQLRRSAGPCWESTFTAAQQNTASRLRASGN